jgi:hypothetical protein
MVHLLVVEEPETGQTKTPPRGGGFRILAMSLEDLSRASIRGPREGTFFRDGCARIRDHSLMMMDGIESVNAWPRRKKAGLVRARLKVLAT